jgi:uncharacterized protein (TIGR03435 family)
MHARIPAAILFLAVSLVPAQTPYVSMEFEVASIKRNVSGSRPWLAPPKDGRFDATSVTVKMLIGVGWGIKITGGPTWIGTEGYDVLAKGPKPDISNDDFGIMMQNLLKDRFALRVHTEKRDAPVYALLPAKRGMILPDAKPEPCITFKITHGAKAAVDPQAGCGAMNVTPEFMSNDRISMAWFAGVLGTMLGHPVIDKTGFAGSFKLRLEFAPLTPVGDVDSTNPSIFTALDEQLGLKLESRKGTEEVLVIDRVERPSEN